MRSQAMCIFAKLLVAATLFSTCAPCSVSSMGRNENNLPCAEQFSMQLVTRDESLTELTNNGDSLHIDADHLSKITKANAHALWMDFRKFLEAGYRISPKGENVTNLRIKNVLTSSGEAVSIVLECTRFNASGFKIRCHDPCSITLVLEESPKRVSGISERACHIESILFWKEGHQIQCFEGMENYDTNFRGKTLLKLSLDLCEHAGYSYQELEDLSRFPCADSVVKLRTKTVGLFTKGYSFYMTHGFFPEAEEEAQVEERRLEWCQAKEIAQATTVGEAVSKGCYDPMSKRLSIPDLTGKHFLEQATSLLKMNDDEVRKLKLGEAYMKIFKKLPGGDASKVCATLRDLQALMYLGDRLGGWSTDMTQENVKDLEDYNTSCPHRSFAVWNALDIKTRKLYARFTWGIPQSDHLFPTGAYQRYCSTHSASPPLPSSGGPGGGWAIWLVVIAIVGVGVLGVCKMQAGGARNVSFNERSNDAVELRNVNNQTRDDEGL